MQKVLLLNQMESVKEMMDPQVVEYLSQGRTETFEGHEGFYLFAFDWYDIAGKNKTTSKILIYFDKEDVFFFCGDNRALDKVEKALPKGKGNEEALYQFFVALLKDDMNALDDYEIKITEAESAAVEHTARGDYMKRITAYRRELLRRKRYYEQLVAIFENLSADDEKLLTRDGKRHFSILQNRAERFRGAVLNLRDYVTQMREAYQAQIDIQQNELMRLFTVITALFLPLTLLVGWYGMNFANMPELHWKYGYACVIALSIGICVALLLWFKKRHWF